MPADEFIELTEEDLGSLIAYLKTLPVVDSSWPDNMVGPVGRMAFLSGGFPLVPAEKIDHSTPLRARITAAATPEFGAYLATSCRGCHGVDFAGGISSAPGDPPSANLTPDPETGLGSWTEVDFVTAMREGKRPDGGQISSAMPWREYAPLTDEELVALWLYFQSLPAVAQQQ